MDYISACTRMSYARHATIIDAPGEYITRCGETAVITDMPERGRRFAYGYYIADGIRESWDISGRISPVSDSQNDIIRKAN